MLDWTHDPNAIQLSSSLYPVWWATLHAPSSWWPEETYQRQFKANNEMLSQPDRTAWDSRLRPADLARHVRFRLGHLSRDVINRKPSPPLVIVVSAATCLVRWLLACTSIVVPTDNDYSICSGASSSSSKSTDCINQSSKRALSANAMRELLAISVINVQTAVYRLFKFFTTALHINISKYHKRWAVSPFSDICCVWCIMPPLTHL